MTFLDLTCFLFLRLIFCFCRRKHFLLSLPSFCMLFQHFSSLLPWGPSGLRHTRLLFFCRVTMISSCKQLGPFRETLKSKNGPLTLCLVCGHWQVFGTYWLSATWTVIRKIEKVQLLNTHDISNNFRVSKIFLLFKSNS